MTNEGKTFFDLYLEYTSKNEAPTFFHRWSIISCLGAYLGRQTYFHHGFFTLYPNMYTMLIGSPGTKKSSAIKISAALLKQTGYNTFGAKKTRQEKFLMDLAEQRDPTIDGAEGTGDILSQNLWGVGAGESVSEDAVTECFVAADEFNNFIGVGNLDFMSILGELWDYSGIYDYKLKNSKSVHIPNPTISILGGNTPTGFSQAFPTDAIGQGFFSRLLLIYAEPSGVKFTFPPPPDKELERMLVEYLIQIKTTVIGEMTLTQEAEDLVDKIYRQWQGIDDVRFEHYTNRRLTHLLKLCVVVAAASLTTLIDVDVVVYANTVLTYTEHLMPKALGEFGNARNATVTHKLLTVIEDTKLPITGKELWKHVSHDLEKRDQMMEILGNLQLAEKIQAVDGGGYLPVRRGILSNAIGVDFSLLSESDIGEQ